MTSPATEEASATAPTPPAVTAIPRRAETSGTVQATRRRGLHSWRGDAFVVPYLVFLVMFGILPMVYALVLAFTDESGHWAGFGNFTRTARDYRFVPAFVHILLYTTVWLVLLVVLVVGLALLLHGRASRASTTFRFLYYIPGALAGAASVLVWLFMLDPSVSPGSFLVHHVLGADVFVESIAPGKLPFIFAMIAFWTGAGGWVVVLYGALNTIPQELEDAARIDGAGPLTLAFRLKLPLIRRWVAYMAILSFATGTQLFVEPQLVNQASLGLVPDTWSSNQLAYQLAFRYADFNAAAAISVDLLAIGLLAAVLIISRTGLFRTEDS
jgi:multiple sugar transport system permease protein